MEKVVPTERKLSKEQQAHSDLVRERNLFIQSKGREGKPNAVYLCRPDPRKFQ